VSEIARLTGSPVVLTLGVALLHFLWQGMALALLAGLGLLALRRATANARHGFLLAVLLLMVAAPILTFAVLPRPAAPAPIVEALPEAAPAELPAAQVSLPLTSPPAAPLSLRDRLSLGREWVMGQAAWLAALWALGVIALSLRLLVGWLGLGRLRRHGAQALPAEWTERLARLAARLGVRGPVSLLASARVHAPMLLGWLKPAILLPAGLVAGLTPSQVEALLAHELAHLRRHDYALNLLQSAAETLLFYHPAVWWLSHRLRLERECCCDDLAVRACGDVVVYARALTELGHFSASVPRPGLAAGGGSLSHRVRRLLSRPAARRRPAWPAGVAALLMVGLLAALLQCSPVAVAAEKHAVAMIAQAPEPPPAPEAPAAPAPPAEAPTASAPAPPAAAAPAAPAPPMSDVDMKVLRKQLDEQIRLVKQDKARTDAKLRVTNARLQAVRRRAAAEVRATNARMGAARRRVASELRASNARLAAVRGRLAAVEARLKRASTRRQMKATLAQERVHLARTKAELTRVQARLQARLSEPPPFDLRAHLPLRTREDVGKAHAAGADPTLARLLRTRALITNPGRGLRVRAYRLRYLSPQSVVYRLGLSDDPGPDARASSPGPSVEAIATGGDLRPFLPDGIEDVVAFPALNSLLIRGTADGVSGLIELLKLIDKKPQQLLISAVTHRGLPENVPLPDVAVQEGKPKDGAWLLPLPAAEKEFRFSGPVTDAIRIATMNLLTASNNVGPTEPGLVSQRRLSLTPRINGDQTITLYLSLTRRRGESAKEMTTTSVVNVRDGVPLAITFSRDGESSTLVLTTSIVKEGE
jgi:beta-lactamase regulating signal transducer with metallopeptidase domain